MKKKSTDNHEPQALKKKPVVRCYFLLCCRFGPYFIEPVIAGLDPKTLEPFIASLDLIGCPMVTEDFVVSGTCTEQMYGMCESLWEPDMVSRVPQTLVTSTHTTLGYKHTHNSR